MEGPPLGPGGEDITWPDQVAPRGRKASSTRKIKPQTSNLLSMRGEEPLDEKLDPRSRLREYVDSKRRLLAKRLGYARPTRRCNGNELQRLQSR